MTTHYLPYMLLLSSLKCSRTIDGERPLRQFVLALIDAYIYTFKPRLLCKVVAPAGGLSNTL